MSATRISGPTCTTGHARSACGSLKRGPFTPLPIPNPSAGLQADNVLYPGTPDYLAHVQAPGGSREPQAAPAPGGSDGSGAERRRLSGGFGAARAAEAPREGGRMLYDTKLAEAAFEVEQRWRREGWAPKRDALAVSRCLGPEPQQDS